MEETVRRRLVSSETQALCCY